MGAKRALLQNGLGKLLMSEAPRYERFVDLFAGSASVSWFVAANTPVPVLANDLQEYSRVLAEAVILRRRPVTTTSKVVADWIARTEATRSRTRAWKDAALSVEGLTAADVEHCRRWSAAAPPGSMLQAYGGHYYSPRQALTFDALIAELPSGRALRQLCLGSVIWAGTRCAAAPGHTAQPFQPTISGLPYIEAAWRRDPLDVVKGAVAEIGAIATQTVGRATTADANEVVTTLRPNDLAFIDPPYSAVQYSRFYHVLEALSVGSPGVVSGTGRYPDLDHRPRSEYSLKTGAVQAMTELLDRLADVGCGAIITFPRHDGSNGLSGDQIVQIAKRRFMTDVHSVASNFSTLGGNGKGRAARWRSAEIFISLTPRRGSGLTRTRLAHRGESRRG
ncbi:MAG TPA: DNA adenine methylase [Ilumatobacter sp.]|nr:DNA adenine methylase [Ilumatobacter sp.]